MPSVTIYANHDVFDMLDAAMCQQVKAVVRTHLPAGGDHAGTPIEFDIVRRHELGECVRKFLIVIEAGNDPERQARKREIVEEIGNAIAKVWGRWDIAVRLRLQDAAFYVHAPEIP